MRLYRVERTDSTNSLARRLIAAGLSAGHEPDAVADTPHGARWADDRAFVVTARAQTAGRGRMGRPWVCAPGSVLMSIALPGRIAAGPGSLRVGLAVLDVVGPMAPGRVSIKWPNDVMLDGLKLAGALIESLAAPPGDRGPGWTIIGIGLNADVEARDLDASGRPVATLRTNLGVRIDPGALAESIAARVIARLNGVPAERLTTRELTELHAALEHRSGVISIRRADGDIRGSLEGVDEDGQAVLATPGGQVRVAAGEMLALR